MSKKSESPRPLTPQPLLISVVDQLACPACLAGLELDETRLTCMGCGRVYPVLDGIPVLIVEHTSTSDPE